MDILIHSLIISGWCLGLRVASDEGNALYFIRDWMERISSESDFLYQLFKPLLLCVACTASIHGFTIYALMWGIEWQMILSIMLSCYINSLGWLILNKLF